MKVADIRPAAAEAKVNWLGSLEDTQLFRGTVVKTVDKFIDSKDNQRGITTVDLSAYGIGQVTLPESIWVESDDVEVTIACNTVTA